MLVFLLGGIGITSLATGLTSQKQEPPSRIKAFNTSENRAPEPTNSPTATLAASEPVRLKIPALDLVSDLSQVAKNDDGTVEVPTGENYDKAAWYKYSPSPGERGSSVILGHVDSVDTGPSVFYNLTKLKPNDKIMVERADKSTAIFNVDRMEQYPKETFPTQEVYGDTSGRSTLKLITCGGEFNDSRGEYDDNIIVFASLVPSS